MLQAEIIIYHHVNYLRMILMMCSIKGPCCACLWWCPVSPELHVIQHIQAHQGKTSVNPFNHAFCSVGDMTYSSVLPIKGHFICRSPSLYVLHALNQGHTCQTCTLALLWSYFFRGYVSLRCFLSHSFWTLLRVHVLLK